MYYNSRLKKNIFSGLTTEFSKIIINLFYPPLMILFWGIENFGVWIFFISIPSILTTLSINVSKASINEIIINIQNKKKNEIFQNTIILTIINLCLITIVIFLFLTLNINFQTLKSFELQDTKIIFFLLMITIYIRFLENLFFIDLISRGKLYIKEFVTIFEDYSSKILVILIGIITNDLIFAALAILLISVIRFLIILKIYANLKNKLKFSIKQSSKKGLLKLIKISIGHISNVYSHIIRHSGVIFVAGIFLNASIVGYISTVKTMFYFMPTRFFSKISNPIQYELTSMFSKKKLFDIKRMFFRSVIFSFLTVSVFLIFSIYFGRDIYDYWTNHKYNITDLFLLLIVLDAIIFILRFYFIEIFLISINKNIKLGSIEFLISFVSLIFLYYNFYNEQSLEFSFFCILCFSCINLLTSTVICLFNFDINNIFKNEIYK
ncbi:hypothetical protein OA845_01800 [Candidatus Pelagibacter sp.]|nr:hypothetical protein [Candidatus Pelagibacter sp.]